MTSGQWVSRQSLVLVAGEFGVSTSTVETWATSASRIVRAAVAGKMDEVRARMLVTLEGVIADARRAGKYREVVQAVDTYGRLLGLMVQKHEVRHMSEDEARRIADELIALRESEKAAT